MNEMITWLKSFVPPPTVVPWRESWLTCLGACIGLLLTELVSQRVLGESSAWFVAPMGASAVLLFALSESPLAQPWSIVGGNLVSALVGITCAKLIPGQLAGAGLAAALAIAAMLMLRCLHPPGGAVAMSCVLGGPAVHSLGYKFAFMPVAVNSLLLVLAAIAFNNVLRHHRYPYRPQPRAPQSNDKVDPKPGELAGKPGELVGKPGELAGKPAELAVKPGELAGFTRADLDEAISSHEELFDGTVDDLDEIVHDVGLGAYHRRSRQIRCRDIMSGHLIAARPEMTLAQAWRLLNEHKLRALPVVQERQRLVGIVTLRDLLPGPDAKPYVSDVMTSHVQMARPEQTLADLVPLFVDQGFHHLPVVDEHGCLLGMVTQSHLVAALFRTRLEEPELA